MKITVLKTALTCLLVLSASPSIAGKLTADQVKALFTGSVYTSVTVADGVSSTTRDAADGNEHIRLGGKKRVDATWRVDDQGNHCVTKGRKPVETCSEVHDMGNGTYHKITGGTHTHTITGVTKVNI